MDFLKEILINILAKEKISISFSNSNSDLAEIIETKSFKALQKIKSIIEDNGLSDFECIERIVCVFEEIGSNGGDRHDY